MRQGDQQVLVDQATTTLNNFMRDPEMKWLQQNIGRAKAVLISPEIVKAGFIVGGSGGRAVLVAKNGGKWVGPAFYTLATASIGFQAGVAASEMVTLVMTDKGMNSLMASSFKFGGDASVAAGPVGAGAKSDVTADLIAFSRSKGVYGGLNLDGTVVSSNTDWDKAYYGKAVLPPDILMKNAASNKGADKLLVEVSKSRSKQSASRGNAKGPAGPFRSSAAASIRRAQGDNPDARHRLVAPFNGGIAECTHEAAVIRLEGRARRRSLVRSRAAARPSRKYDACRARMPQSLASGLAKIFESQGETAQAARHARRSDDCEPRIVRHRSASLRLVPAPSGVDYGLFVQQDGNACLASPVTGRQKGFGVPIPKQPY
jgi:lipid-binding SYLF domain-containing protein